MTVMIGEDRIVVSGTASVEDAEPLLVALIDRPDCPIDVGGLDQAHLAVVQLLHAARRPLLGTPDNAFLRDVVLRKLIQISSI